MNQSSQQIFMLFFAIFWGTSANAWPNRKPFNWPLITYRPVLARLALSFVLLNITPIAYFAWMFRILAAHDVGVVLAVLPAFSIFGIYRVWLAVSQSNMFYYRLNQRPAELTAEMEPEVTPLVAKFRLRNLVVGMAYVAVGTLPTLCCVSHAA